MHVVCLAFQWVRERSKRKKETKKGNGRKGEKNQRINEWPDERLTGVKRATDGERLKMPFLPPQVEASTEKERIL